MGLEGGPGMGEGFGVGNLRFQLPKALEVEGAGSLGSLVEQLGNL